ncbi:MAG: Flp family type IVb pilin [Alphaproteobacteria bacterium]
MIQHLRCFLKDKTGATAIEYGLIAAGIAVAIIAAVGLLGDELDAMFRDVTSAIENR